MDNPRTWQSETESGCMEDDQDVVRSRSGLSLSWRVSLLIAILLVASAVITTAFAFRAIQSELYEQSEEAVGNTHASVAAVIEAEYDDIERFRATALDRRKESLRDVAAPLAVTLDALRQEVAAGTLTEQQAQDRALKLLKEVRFANNDYFFTYNRDLIAISHPDERFEGRDLSDLQDPDGVFVLQEIRDVALNQGSGFVPYRWERLDGAEPSPKLGYVFHYEPWDWIIGTGVYIDDIDTEVAERTALVAADLEETFEDISFANEGFFFIVDRNGDIIAAANSEVRALEDTPEGRANLASIVAAAPTEPGVEEQTTFSDPWQQGSDSTWSLRTSTTAGGLDWILVSAVPEARLGAPGRALAVQLAGLSVFVLLLGLALGFVVSRRITKPVDQITAAARDLAQGNFEPSTLDSAAGRSDEVGDLARTFQRMGNEIIERERRLREQVERLTIEIDRSRVSEQVAQITESEYFQELRSRTEELRRRER